MPHPHNNPRKQDPRFLTRDPDDGSARVRIRFTGDLPSLIEEAAGDLPPVKWIEQTIEREARREVKERRARRHLPPGGDPPRKKS